MVRSLVDSASSAGSLVPPIHSTDVSESWSRDAGTQQQHSADHDLFFSINNNNASQPTPHAALLAPSDSPDGLSAAAASSPRPCDPGAGFGSPAAVPQDDQLPSNEQQASKQPELLQKQQQVQQQLLQHQYSHQHGSHEQLPFGHLQDIQHHGNQQQQFTPSKPGRTPIGNHRQKQQHHEQLMRTPLHCQLQHPATPGTPSSLSPSLQPAIERVATLGQILRQHGASQGEAHATARLLLATISAKQVKTRQMIASVTPPVTPNSGLQQQLLPLQQETDKQHQQLQLQLKAATDQLAVVKAELVAAASELAAARTAASQQAVLLQQRSHELQEMHDSLLRQESGYQAEVDALQERLLDAEGQLAKLSAVLPGGWRRGTNAVGAAAAGTPASMSMPGPARAADVAEANQSVSETGNPAVAAYGSPPKLALQLTPSLSLQTPDQAAAAQYKSWLRESQAALMAAQEDLMNQERQIKQLERQLQQMQQRHHHQEGPQQDQGQQEDTDDAVIARMPQHWQEEGQGPESLKPHSQQHILDLQAALDEAHSATQAAQAVADAMRSERDSLRVELSQLSQQVQSAVAARAEAVAALAAAQHAGELYRDQIQQLTSQVSTHGADEDAAARPDASDSSSDAAAAAVKTATAEAELLEARETAAAALAAVAELQQQLQQMQEQQREFGKQSVAAASVTDQQGHSQRQLAHVPAEQPVDQSEQQQQLQEQPEGSVEYQLLRATSVNQALQSELVDTKQRLLLLLQLIKRAATQAGRQQQLPAELAELADAACTAATQFVAADDGSTGGDDGAFDVACLLQVVSGLQQRYCCSQEHHQLLLRGKEMQFLLENALQQVHLIKAAGSDFGCSCPSEAEYQLLAGGLDDTAKQHTPAAAAVAPLPAVTAAADMPIVDQAHDNLLSGLEHFITAAPAALTYQMPGSCSNDALRDSAGYGAAGSRLGFAVADEGLGYDGLDGSWWATSTIGNTTAEDLPAFLLPKAE